MVGDNIMATGSVEDRLAALEAEVAQLKLRLNGGNEEQTWKRVIGTFANDPAYDKAMKIGREYRESLRPKQTKKRGRSDGDT
jgi:hypothetical protein